MPTRFPPRREPRVLAVARNATRLFWAVVDPWELRGIGELECSERVESRMLRRLIRREKPTVITALGERLAEKAERAARGTLVPFVTPPTAHRPRRTDAELYPELPLFAPRSELARVAALAIATVVHSPIPPRTYAKSRRNRAAARSA
jgi:hypothetical protein